MLGTVAAEWKREVFWPIHFAEVILYVIVLSHSSTGLCVDYILNLASQRTKPDSYPSPQLSGSGKALECLLENKLLKNLVVSRRERHCKVVTWLCRRVFSLMDYVKGCGSSGLYLPEGHVFLCLSLVSVVSWLPNEVTLTLVLGLEK